MQSRSLISVRKGERWGWDGKEVQHRLCCSEWSQSMSMQYNSRRETPRGGVRWKRKGRKTYGQGHDLFERHQDTESHGHRESLPHWATVCPSICGSSLIRSLSWLSILMSRMTCPPVPYHLFLAATDQRHHDASQPCALLSPILHLEMVSSGLVISIQDIFVLIDIIKKKTCKLCWKRQDCETCSQVARVKDQFFHLSK